ncbi:MAG: winged helix-turn-helix domain-containing protein [Candidatus Bipolaricaulaceae bacterium]
MQEEILRLLSAGPKSVEELAELLQSSPGSVRRQLSRLRRDPALVQSLPHSNPKKFALTIHGQKFLFP